MSRPLDEQSRPRDQGRPDESARKSTSESYSTGATVEQILEEIRGYQAAGYRVMLNPALSTGQRQLGMRALLDAARSSPTPELACHAVERALFDAVFGRDREPDLRERWLEEALRRGALAA